jgi:hypothetical protein
MNDIHDSRELPDFSLVLGVSCAAFAPLLLAHGALLAFSPLTGTTAGLDHDPARGPDHEAPGGGDLTKLITT